MTHGIEEAVASTAELRAGLECALGRGIDAPRRIVDFERRPSVYGSSYALEELDLTLADGTRLRLMFKDLSRRAMLAAGQRAKPGFLYDPLREIQMYRQVLAPGPPGTATCHGAVVGPARERYWLFLERVEGVGLDQVGELAIWEEAARWLACFHDRFQSRPRLADLARSARLMTYGPAYYRLWLERARTFLARLPRRLASPERRRFARLIDRYDRVIARLAELPSTIIHGEAYAANVLVRAESGEGRICPVDWEMAALGPGLIDLAALSAGSWSEDERRALVRAYFAALRPGCWTGIEALLEAFDYCRLHLAIQWLGWSDAWSPPRHQAHDWLAEALALAERLHL